MARVLTGGGWRVLQHCVLFLNAGEKEKLGQLITKAMVNFKRATTTLKEHNGQKFSHKLD